MEDPKLNADEYWEWRNKIEEMQHAETKLKLMRSTYALMDKDIEISKLKNMIFKETVRSHEDKLTSKKDEYNQLKKKIEDRIGQSLNNCTISDTDFSVKKLEE